MNYPTLPKWQLIAVPAVGIILAIFYFGKYFIADELINAHYQIEALQRDLQTTRDLLDAERSRSTVAEREADVARRANNLLRASERDRQDEIADLQADLEFYRRLGGANGSQAPLSVHYLELQPTQSPRVYRIVFSLTQNLGKASVISGQIQLGVDGIRNGAAEHLSNKQLLAESTEPLSFQFKHFQQLERLITLPEGFEPNKLTIQLKSSSLGAPIKQSTQWQSLIKQTLTDPPTDVGPVDEIPLSNRYMIEKSVTNRHS